MLRLRALHDLTPYVLIEVALSFGRRQYIFILVLLNHMPLDQFLEDLKLVEACILDRGLLFVRVQDVADYAQGWQLN